jgi:hypothetical protein
MDFQTYINIGHHILSWYGHLSNFMALIVVNYVAAELRGI